MKGKRGLFLLIVTFSSCLAMQRVGLAVDDTMARGSLQELRGFYVVVNEQVNDEPRNLGLEEMIRIDTELKLRLAGIKVLSKEEFHKDFKDGFLAWLYLNVMVIVEAQSSYTYSVSVEVRQAVGLMRDLRQFKNVFYIGETWSVACMGSALTLDRIRHSTKDTVDRFINAYLSVNPKK